MKETGFNGYVYDFSVDYDAIAVDDMLDIHKCLMKKNNMINVWFYLKTFFIGLIILLIVNLLALTPLRCIEDL